MAAYIDSAEFASSLPTQEGAADVIAELNAQLAQIKTADPQQLLDGIQQNMEAVVNQ
jgi:multiple sugar transport system substrate-binding protein